MATIHPTSVIDSTAVIADDVCIGASCVIGPNVTIGSGTKLLNHVTVQCNTTIGEDNRFHPFSVIGGDPQDKKYANEVTALEIGNRNEIREHVTIHRGTEKGGGITVVGDDNLLMVGSHVAHRFFVQYRLDDDVFIGEIVPMIVHVAVSHEDHYSESMLFQLVKYPRVQYVPDREVSIG